jgi:hypothetical protein
MQKANENWSCWYFTHLNKIYLYLIIKAKGFLPRFWGFHLLDYLRLLPPVSISSRCWFVRPDRPWFIRPSHPNGPRKLSIGLYVQPSSCTARLERWSWSKILPTIRDPRWPVNVWLPISQIKSNVGHGTSNPDRTCCGAADYHLGSPVLQSTRRDPRGFII